MIARPYIHSEDAEACDRLLRGQGITNINVDQIFVVGERGKPSGILVLRPGAYIHELECGNDLLSRARAEALVSYALGWARAARLRTGIFLVRGANTPMLKFVEKFAVRQTDPNDVLYTVSPE